MQIKIGSGISRQLASPAYTLAFIAAAAISSQASAATVQNHAPMISGSPASSATAGAMYTFQPNASDADGNSLVFSVTSKPVWARLDRATGRFYGTPTNAQAGSYEEIEITVSDGMARTKLPKFTITVNADAKLGQAPSISGTPATSATVAKPYSFQPTAMDMDGDALTFSITGRPAWATLDKQTGRLSGTPTVVGAFTGIEISVSDGITRTQLPKFAVTVNPAVATARNVTVSWLAPTQNVDGTALTNLSSYHIMYGNQPGVYTQRVGAISVGLTTYTIENLPAGTYYFAMTATNSAGSESALSPELALDLT